MIVFVIENGKLTHDIGAWTAASIMTSNYHVTGVTNALGHASIVTCHVPAVVANLGENVYVRVARSKVIISFRNCGVAAPAKLNLSASKISSPERTGRVNGTGRPF